MVITKCCKYIISSVLWTPEEERWVEKKDQGEKAPFSGLAPLPLACLKRGLLLSWLWVPKGKGVPLTVRWMFWVKYLPPYSSGMLSSHTPQEALCMNTQSIPSSCNWAAGCSGRACLLHPRCYNTPRRRHLLCSLEIVFLLMKTIKKDPLLLDGCGAGL